MSLLSRLSIKKKLIGIQFVTAFFVLVLASAAFVANDLRSFRRSLVSSLSSTAQLVGESSASSLIFSDEETAAEILATLHLEPHVLNACTYDDDGAVFATYARPGFEGFVCPPAHDDEHAFGVDHLTIFRGVAAKDNRVGTIYLRADLGRLRERVYEYVKVAAVVLIAGLLLSLSLALMLQRGISRPVLNLVAATRGVSQTGDYERRVPREGEDELGELCDGFNEMLGEIQQRDHSLREARDALEVRVMERTRELAAANAELHEVNTELVEARDRALEASRVKSQFLANMSHELRTPLNAIIGYSEMLQEEAEDEGLDAFVPDLQRVHGAGRHLLTLISDILDLSKIEAGRMDLYLEDFSVRALVDDVVSTVQPLVEKHSSTLEVEVHEEVGIMHADQTRVRQNLINLLSNAAKFTDADRIWLRIRSRTGDEGDWLEFEVEDRGIGMNADQVGRIFDAFTQADLSTTRKYGGTGLGLAITRRFCELMGGTISVASEEGKGSTFTMLLPVRMDEEAPDHDVEPEANAAGLADKDIVLVIDDDPAMRDLMKRFLQREGYGAAVALNGPQGLEKARELRPVAITLDVNMPEMDGWNVLQELKSDAALAQIPVVLLTMEEDRSRGFALGAVDYLSKPVDRNRLKGLLQRYCPKASEGPVLVVEDEAVTRLDLRVELEKSGWEVAEATNGREALERIAQRRPQLILLDLMMPEMDGFEFVEALHREEDWRSVPIVVLTALQLDAEEHERLRGYVSQVMHKGAYKRGDLLNQVRELLPGTRHG